MNTALVRGVPDSFADALRSKPEPPLDVELAREQHGAYVASLARAGLDILEVAADEAHPDCVFIEDAAVVIGSTVVAARSGAHSRRGEVSPVIDALEPLFTVAAIDPPGTLDGGDVIVGADVVLVGATRRTNAAGIAQLAAIAANEGFPLVSVDVHEGLHLKSVVLPLDAGTVLVTPRAVDEEALKGLRILYEPEEERHGASALPLPDGRVLVTASSPATAARLSVEGHDVSAIDVSELLAADGGLTCLSILFDRPTT